MTDVESYWRTARDWWREKRDGHCETCPCLPCSDLRQFLGIRPITPAISRHTTRTNDQQQPARRSA